MRTSKLLRPPRLLPGDRVALCAPSSCPPLDRPRFKHALKRTLQFFEELGLKPFLSASATHDPRYFGRDPRARAEDLNVLARDRSVRGVFSLVGGAGGAEILPFLDYDVFDEDPKIFHGFSDATAWLNAITLKSGLITFYGENALSSLSKRRKRSVDAFRRALMEGQGGPVPVWGDRERWQGGRGAGRLVGGNLYTLQALLGTRWAPEFEHTVLFLEEVEEGMDDLNHALQHLKLAGATEHVAAVVVGQLVEIADSEPTGLSHADVFRRAIPRRVPILKVAEFGHWQECVPMPIGGTAHVDAREGVLEIEPAVE